jgi:hypothetical protein
MEEVYLRPVYKLGKITNKYLIIEILAYSIEEFTFICDYLHSCSRSMRNLLKKNFTVIRNMLKETHMFEAILRLTFNYKTSRAGHQLLEKIIKRNCEKARSIDYGL